MFLNECKGKFLGGKKQTEQNKNKKNCEGEVFSVWF